MSVTGHLSCLDSQKWQLYNTAGYDRIGHSYYFCDEGNPSCVKGVHLKNLAKEAFLTVLITAWVVGFIDQFESWSMTAVYITITLVMVAITFADRRVLS